MTDLVHRFCIIAATVTVVLGGHIGHVDAENPASSSETLAAAEQLFVQGRQLMARGDFAGACEKFAASLELDATLGTQLNLAHCYEKLGKLASAWARYRGSAELAGKIGDEKRAEFARERAIALEPRLPRLVIRVAAQDGLSGFRVTRDDMPVAPALHHTAIFVDPGAHRVVAVADDHEAFSTEVVAVEGEQVVIEIPALNKVMTKVVNPPAEKFVAPEQDSATPDGSPAGHPGPVETSWSTVGSRSAPGALSEKEISYLLATASQTRDKQVTYRYWMALFELIGPSLALVTDEPEFLLPSFAFSGALTHLTQGNNKHAATSLALRGIPALSVRLAGADGGSSRLVALSMIGMVAATIIDYGFLARKTVTTESRSPALLEAGGVRASPTLTPSARGDLVVGLSGTF